MNTVEELRHERNGRTVPLTMFLGDYRKYNNETCYGFVEGKDDPSYYRRIINNKLPTNCFIILYPCDGKDNVHYIHKQIDWRTFSKNRIVFFMDRDLSCILNDKNIINDKNVYITDKYSIENDIVSRETLESIMRDLLGFASTDRSEIDKVIEMFERQKIEFEKIMMYLMANIIMWKRNKISPANYNNVKIKSFISIQKGEVLLQKSVDDLIKQFYKQSNVSFNHYNETILNRTISEIYDKRISKKIVRGKYLSEFFILFCNSIHKDCIALGINKTHQGRPLNSRDIMETIAPRSRPPRTLNVFISNTIEKYYKWNKRKVSPK